MYSFPNFFLKEGLKLNMLTIQFVNIRLKENKGKKVMTEDQKKHSALREFKTNEPV